jgi:sulfur relay (sulfurtransferase) complex TusBCD TusD component (DsrE family)
LGTQARKLQLPVPLEYRVVSTGPAKLELLNRWVPKPELGNQLRSFKGNSQTGSNQSAKEEVMQKLLFILSKGFEKAGGATRAMQFAAVAAEQGHHVEIFLIDDAIHWAQVGMAEGIRSTTGEHMKDMLDKLIAEKCLIHVCKACADKRLISPDELIHGARISTASELVIMMASPDYKVFTF